MKLIPGDYCEAWIRTLGSTKPVLVKARYAPMPHHIAGLQWTASGYGRRIPMRYMVQWHGRWRRVYVCQQGNAGTVYIGNLADGITVQELCG